MIVMDAIRWLLYVLALRNTSPPPPYVDPDWDEFLRQKYGIAKPFSEEE
jgi:hypothetical protein